MTSVASFPITTMPQFPGDFEPYPGSSGPDSFANAVDPDQGYANDGFANPFLSTFSSLDSAQAIYAPAQLDYNPQPIKHEPNQYSPAASPPAVSQAFDMVQQQQHHFSAAEFTTSMQSTSTTALASPSQAQAQFHETWAMGLPQNFVSSAFSQELEKHATCVDPSLTTFGATFAGNAFQGMPTASPRAFVEHPPSPAPSNTSSRSHSQGYTDSRRFRGSGPQSPFVAAFGYHPYSSQQHYPGQRRPSQGSIHSRQSGSSRGSFDVEESTANPGQCPIPECGRTFKDLKAHMLTHQQERPEKCPIPTCEYHVKGFARKYDKNRHTLTHYKGTMVCGFCPGSGSAAEKSFNRADVFKRHLTSVHGVEQTPPNSRKKSPTTKKGINSNETPGVCSTCGVTFANVQDFYEHLDECVLRVVQQADPCEAINQKNLGSVEDDKQVKETLDRHNLPLNVDYTAPDNYDDADEDDDSEEQVDNDDANDETYGSRNPRSGKGAIRSRKTGNSS